MKWQSASHVQMNGTLNMCPLVDGQIEERVVKGIFQNCQISENFHLYIIEHIMKCDMQFLGNHPEVWKSLYRYM